ncbi:glutamate/gamma-aminobutyrate family transporter YjeM [Ligilactobacillus aviarius]|uniref:glutamate/gamma-aminobutyrate family transporter YjeM n=1 Tax=Ligilactobacillus aviarius TaxID=1606 RepID=UPI0007D92080|nr:glutamate/gamma-aminobutyrate family transporter YjeM [Ligilactobacillus aviarius]OAQ04179.1 glutamate/gamma-aminobutyrate family transporter YjeM [Ligilactobacillus aviarius]OAQ04534.1 glutamate/gamma-aminobutyrate family transporter YjeM [Ligilactobacillus aviarius]OAQ08752.1 glutamate/gamma-aminobutyrate family transporter YjeM [Ligilactobacillus aviarius]OAS76020.1 glutamate/gamma-aminobutyrate family transporter YjeM [Ligilactobacillus aviarius]OAS78477.1 glutamate/gamma-aminobutyrate 
MSENNNAKKITTGALVLMIFSTIFGFANTPVAFMQMGYGAILWYILGALLYFLPSSLMYAEYGSALKESKGGIYSWLDASISEKWSFIATFIWLSAWVIWQVMVSQKICITISTIIFGHDTTNTWHLFGLNSTLTVALISIIGVIAITWLVNHGIDTIAKISSIGGLAVMLLNVTLILSSVFILFKNHFQLAQPIQHVSQFATSVNPQFQSPIAMISFMIYAIFAYGGLESMGGVTDSLDKPEKTFPRAIIISTIVIGIGYALNIFLWGISTNWNHVINHPDVNLGNITYVLMQNLGLELGKAFHLSTHTALTMGTVFSRLSAIGMLCAYLGSFFVLIYSPLKSFIMGSPKELWPEKVTKLNKKGMPSFALWVQTAIVCVIIGGVAIASTLIHQDSKFLFNLLTSMSNVASTLPYLFLVAAFPFFKKRQDLDRPFEAFHSRKTMLVIVTITLITLVIANGFTIIQPFIEKDWVGATATVAGPLVFGIFAWALYTIRSKKIKQ